MGATRHALEREWGCGPHLFSTGVIHSTLRPTLGRFTPTKITVGVESKAGVAPARCKLRNQPTDVASPYLNKETDGVKVEAGRRTAS